MKINKFNGIFESVELNKSSDGLGGLVFMKPDCWYWEHEKSKLKELNHIECEDVEKYIDIEKLNVITREVMAELFNDPDVSHTSTTLNLIFRT